MRTKFAFSTGLLILAGIGPAFASAPQKAPADPAPAAAQANAKNPGLKDILLKLVRQDEYLDEAMETLTASGRRMSAHDLSAMGLSLKMIAGNLNSVAARNKLDFACAKPGSGQSKYINTMLSYSRKMDRKAVRLNELIGQLAAKNKKAAMRDSLSSRKGVKKVRGKKLALILEEQRAMETLTADAKALRAAARGVNATSKWLYIASK